MIGYVTGYQVKINYDPSKPDGIPKKLMNSQWLENMGWKASVSLVDGLKIAYEDFVN